MSRRHGDPWLHRIRATARSSPLLIVLALVGILAAVALTVLGILDRQDADQADAQRAQTEVALDETAEQARSLAEQIRGECAAGQLDGPVCERAADVARTPVPAPTPAAAPLDSVLTRAEVERVVAAYLLAHPPPAGRPPTPAEVAAAVAEFLIANPPEPGRPPTPAEVAGAVALWFADNPPQRGEQGEPGRPPTPEEVRTAVDAWFVDHPPQAGPPGPTCPDGTTLRQVTYGDGVVGVGCVFDEQPTPTPDPPIGVLPG